MVFKTAFLPQILILLFLLVTFGISFIEKISDWKGTLFYISEIFKTTFIKAYVKPLLVLLVILEILTVLFLLVGILQLIIYKEKDLALLGSVFSCLSIIYMLIGQRIAKDYPGSTSLTVYFILSVFGVFLLN